ncbi:MAG: cell envelope integrity protein TolA, partial [Pseudomonadota bacterium]
AKEARAAKEAEAQARQRAAQQLREQLAAESSQSQVARQAAARKAEAADLLGKYIRQIKEKVSRNWSSTDIKAGLSSRVRVRLDPSGNVLTVRTISSSGNAAFDRAVEAAVMRSSPLPVPNRPDLYSEFREIDFNFSAKDIQNG